MARDARGAYGTSRMSPQRERIARAIDSFDGAFTAEELTHVLSAHPSAPGQATVYRALTALEESGFVARVGERDGATLYAKCETEGHHHHLVCIGCGHVSAISCPVDDSVIRAASRERFVITHHEVTLYGVCRSCLASGWTKEVH